MRGKLMIIFLLFLVLVSGVYASLDCVFDPVPYYSEIKKISWVCSSDIHSYVCLSYILDGNGQLLNVDPSPVDVREIGRVDKFVSQGRDVRIYFSPIINVVRSGVSYVYGVICSNENETREFNTSIIPVYREFDFVAEFMVFVKNNVAFLIILIVMAVVLLAVVVYVVKKARKGELL